jgi:predicted HAD superfamily Cof-like phosphohydrolase
MYTPDNVINDLQEEEIRKLREENANLKLRVASLCNDLYHAKEPISNFDRTSNWLEACGKEVGNADDLRVQIGCHIEEFVEFLASLDVIYSYAFEPTHYASEMLSVVAEDLKTGKCRVRIEDKVACLDALCDSQVTGDGIAWLADFNKYDADKEVLDANDRKLVDGKPIILEGGKIGKPEGWWPADVSRFA